MNIVVSVLLDLGHL